jgi:hypothetical protein
VAATEVTIRVTTCGDSTTEPTKQELDQALTRFMRAAAGCAGTEHGDASHTAMISGLGGIGTDSPVRGL